MNNNRSGTPPPLDQIAMLEQAIKANEAINKKPTSIPKYYSEEEVRKDYRPSTSVEKYPSYTARNLAPSITGTFTGTTMKTTMKFREGRGMLISADRIFDYIQVEEFERYKETLSKQNTK